MRLVQVVGYMGIGAILGQAGHYWYTWEYWGVLVLTGVIDLSSYLQGAR